MEYPLYIIHLPIFIPYYILLSCFIGDAIRSSASKQIEEGALRQKLQEYNTKITMHNYQLDEKINICKKYSQDICKYDTLFLYFS